MVAQFALLVIIPDSASESLYDRTDLLVREDFIETCFFNVQDFSPQRQDCLERTVAPLLGTASCAVSLNDVELAILGVAVGAVGEFAGQIQPCHC